MTRAVPAAPTRPLTHALTASLGGIVEQAGIRLADFKVVATRGGIQFQQTAIAAPNNTMEGRSRNRITAAGLKSVRMLFNNWYCTGSAPVVETLNLTALPFQAALEWDTPAAYAPALTNGASPNVAGGLDFLLTDEIKAADLGLSTYDQYGVYWERVSSLLATGTWLQGGKALRIAGEFAFRHNPAALQAYGTGAMTQSGGSGQRAYMPVAVIGKPADPNYKALLGIGDSRMQGSSDSDDTVEGANGFLQRACMWNGSKAIASLNLGRSGDSLVDWNAGNLRRRHLVPLCSHAVIWYGFNDVNTKGRTGAQVVADTEALADDLRSLGIKKIAVLNQPPYTSGTFTTEAGQTAFGGWATPRAAINAGLAASAHFDTVIDASTILQGTDTTKWKANYTTDGIHPSPAGHADLTTALQAVMTAWGF